ncbi:hypothetical protein DYB38_008145 [Aphanomyces astaci]|uniref:EF-hand domain-containing protein n=1 Tax=Aphanomyces astaci TaxID=112090 RepID=A0A397C9S9_APHAT|nr:hypothetical protein DYB38_008145 [Aphanomyces astaci]
MIMMWVDTAMSGELDLSSVKLHDAIHMDWPLKASQIEEMIRVLVKYDADMFDAFNALFNALPLAHVVNRSIFVVHGGLSDAPLTLAQVPLGLATSRRGAGVVFGPDVCAAFLRLNQLKMVVRSHEVIREGFMWTFDVDEVTADGRVPEVPPSHVPLDMGDVPENMLLTLFSCSNYCHDSNRRSLIRGLPAFRSIEDHNRRNIMQLLLSHKVHNMVTVDTWAAVLRQVLELDLDWKELAPRMAAVDAQGCINYVKFLASFRAVYEGHREWHGVFDALYPHRKALEAIFCFFDRDQSGQISMDEFKRGCLLLNDHLPSPDRWKDPIALFRDIDM